MRLSDVAMSAAAAVERGERLSESAMDGLLLFHAPSLESCCSPIGGPAWVLASDIHKFLKAYAEVSDCRTELGEEAGGAFDEDDFNLDHVASDLDDNTPGTLKNYRSHLNDPITPGAPVIILQHCCVRMLEKQRSRTKDTYSDRDRRLFSTYCGPSQDYLKPPSFDMALLTHDHSGMMCY